VGGLSFKSLAVGYSHTCGVTETGAAHCWGENFFGELGDGASGGSVYQTAPVPVSTTVTFARLGAGSFATCGLSGSSETYCWGSVGTNLTPLPKALVPVRFAPEVELVTLSLSAGHVCGLTATGAAYCWGVNSSGQLGDGTMTDRVAPVRVSTLVRFRQISTGAAHTCATSVDGEIFCWGAGPLGQGTGPDAQSSTPLRVPAP
jgi:alpha-tubulin suppressor-like RCC1 family protein